MSWEEMNFEKYMYKMVKDFAGDIEGDKIFTKYKDMRNTLIDNLYDRMDWPLLKLERPTEILTDHSENHIRGVFKQVGKLLPELPKEERYFTEYEIYCIGLGVIFHDVGNIYGRDGHQKAVAPIYAWVNGMKDIDLHEQAIVNRIAEAHCGKINDSADTIQQLEECKLYKNEPIRIREIAAIVRFADELDEGLHRTSKFLLSKNLINESSQIHHQYSKVSQPHPDYGNNRIVLQYNINLELEDKSTDEIATEFAKLEELLKYIYYRIIKLEEERRYNRYYTCALNPFKMTEFSINFWKDNMTEFRYRIERTILDDKIVPGDSGLKIEDIFPKYSVDNVINLLKSENGG